MNIPTEQGRWATIFLSLFLVVWAGQWGCDRSDESSESSVAPQSKSAERQEQPEQKRVEQPPEPTYGKRHEQAMSLMDGIIAAVKEGYGKDGAETFPGGTEVSWATAGSAPELGERYTYGTEEDAGSAGEPTFERIGISQGTMLPVMFTYRTGPGKGSEATATVKAVADFQPSKEGMHTIEQELSIDPKTGTVNVFPRLVRNRWK